MTRLFAKDGCTDEYFQGQERPKECLHGYSLDTEKQIANEEQRKLKAVETAKSSGVGAVPAPGQETVRGGVDSSTPRRRSGLKRGKGFSASAEQQARVRNRACLRCGCDHYEVGQMEAAHVYPRRFATCGCADGVVPLCHECHAAYDRRAFDLLPLLIAHGFRRELVHAVVEHDAPIFHVIEIVTGTPWVPKQRSSA
jgi:hypothetical protein